MNISVIFFSLLAFVSANFEDDCVSRVEKADIGASCSEQLKILCGQRHLLFTLWDASSRILRNGMTAISSQDLGNYDLCHEVDTQIGKTTILGSFCPFQWTTVVPVEFLEEVVEVIDEFSLDPSNENYLLGEGGLKTNLLVEDGTENFTVVGSLCISDGCTPAEFTEIFKTYLYPVVDINKYECVTKNSRRDVSVSQWVMAACLALVVLIVISCTIVHVVYHYSDKGKPNEYIEGFSAFHNGKKLVTISNDTVNQIQCMNGLRFISMLWIIAGHGFLTGEAKPVFNADQIDVWKSALYSEYMEAAVFAVDTFFFLSGFLLTYGYLKQMQNRSVVQQIKGIPVMYISRYLRLTPALGAMFLFSISVLKLIGDGPMWFISYDVVGDTCAKNWWRFFLYIQNYYSEGLCYTQTWYLSADMQMFVFSPLVLIPISMYYQKNIRSVIAGLIILIAAFVGISLAIPFLFEDYSNDYDTHSRVSDYLVGVIGGVIFHKIRGKEIKINRVVNVILWASVVGVMIALAAWEFNATLIAKTKLKYIIFSEVYRPIWCSCILWIVFSCYHGYGGIINWFLSNGLFQVGARLSYCMYVLHGMVILHSVGITRTMIYFGDYEMINVDWGLINTTIIISAFWTLLFEGPMIMLNKKLVQFLGSSKKSNEPKKDNA